MEKVALSVVRALQRGSWEVAAKLHAEATKLPEALVLKQIEKSLDWREKTVQVPRSVIDSASP
jgi:hypothetical protein